MAGKSSNQSILIVLGVIAVLLLGYGILGPSAKTVVTSGGQAVPPADVKCSDVQCEVVPTYTYSAVDAYSTTSFSGTGGTTEVKQNGNAPVTTLANPTKCDQLQYWNNNGTTGFCEIATEPQVRCGSVTIQTKCYKYAGLSLTAKDLADDEYLSNSNTSTTATANMTLGANGVGNLDLKISTTAKYVAAPFGGCMAIDYPTTIASVTATYNGAALNACPYVWTYTATTSGNAYRLFEIPAGFDKAGLGDIKDIQIQLLAGSTNPSGGVNIAIRAANYYITNAGEFALGVEQDKNQATTTAFNAAVGTRAFYID